MVGKPIRLSVWQLRAEQAQCVSVLFLNCGQEQNEIRQQKYIINTVVIVREAELMFKFLLVDRGAQSIDILFAELGSMQCTLCLIKKKERKEKQLPRDRVSFL